MKWFKRNNQEKLNKPEPESLPKQEQPKQEQEESDDPNMQLLRAVGVPEHLVQQFKGFDKSDPREKEAAQLEKTATNHMLSAEKYIISGNEEACLEYLYKARVAAYEATEIHKAISPNHPAIAIINMGISQMDRSIAQIKEYIEQGDDYPDYGGAIY